MQDTELKLGNNTHRFTSNLKKKEPVLIVVLNNLDEMLWEYGPAKNVPSKLLELLMTLPYSAKIIVDAKEKTKAIFDSINIDNKFYPENPTLTKMEFKEKIVITIESEHLPHLRANINSSLRLVQASYDSIESVQDH